MKTYQFEWIILEFFDQFKSTFLNIVNWFITNTFGSLFLVIFLFTIYWIIDKKVGKRLVFAFIISMCFNNLIKGLVRRQRPFIQRPDLRKLDISADGATGSSFPSGHTMNSTSCYTGIFYSLRKKKFLVLKILLICTILIVGITRLYLGVHYPTDVLTGWILGLAITLIMLYLQEHFNNKILYLIMILIFIPFPFINNFGRDFVKAYGLLIGFVSGSVLEERFINFNNQTSTKHKILRMIIGILLVALTYLIYSIVPTNVHNHILFTLIMHIFIMFNGIFTAPLLFNKIKNN